MQTTELALQDSVLDSLSSDLKDAIRAYAVEAELPPAFVIELAIVFFLDPDAMTFDDCRVGIMREPLARLQTYKGTFQGIKDDLLEQLPNHIQATIKAYAAETGLPSETVMEFAIVHFLEPDATTFEELQKSTRSL